MNNGYLAGEVRPMIDREPPNAAETRGASIGTRFGETSGAGSSPRRLADRSGTAHCRLSEAGNWGISVQDRPEMDEAFRRLEDAVDETLRASFPASDPPFWTLGRSERDRHEPEDATERCTALETDPRST